MIGIIGAMKIEVEQLKNEMQNVVIHKIGNLEIYQGKLLDIDVVVAVAGVGKVNAAICTQTMILKFNPNLIINVGVAGGLSDKLKVGDIAIATSVVEHDMDTSPLGDPLGFITGLDVVNMPCSNWAIQLLKNSCECVDNINVVEGIIASGDQFINSIEKKNWIVKNFNAVATEMEGASIGHVCYANGVDFCVLRAISDGADDDSHLSFIEFTELAAKNSVKIILKFLSNLKGTF